MASPTNPLKIAVQAGTLLKGIWLCMGSQIAAEIAGHAGFDWCLIDGEHAPYDPTNIRAQLIALAGTPAHALVRVPVAEDWILKQMLDIGAQNLLVPMVNTADQARHIVSATRYPLQGHRGMGADIARVSGFGATPNYAATANDNICLFVQAESVQAIDNLEEICAVPGVDGVFIGPADLACDMGYRDQMGHPDVVQLIGQAIARITASGKTAGIISASATDRARYVEQGVTFLGMGAEVSILARGLRALAAE
jgi:4-hydroxy-2-oxoheptanedioate aldolase